MRLENLVASLVAIVAGCHADDPKATTTDAPAATDDSVASPDAYEGPTGTKTYQQDVAGYTSTRSVGISTYGGLGNLGEYNENGMTFADGQNDWCTGTDIPSGNYSEIWLLRFDDLGLPAGAQVVSAKLDIHGNGDGSTGLFYAGSYLAASWFGGPPITCAGCSNSPVGWRYRDGSAHPWGAMGGGAAGTDTIANKAFRLPEVGDVSIGSAPTEYSTALDPAVKAGLMARRTTVFASSPAKATCTWATYPRSAILRVVRSRCDRGCRSRTRRTDQRLCAAHSMARPTSSTMFGFVNESGLWPSAV